MTHYDTYAGRLKIPAFDWSDLDQQLKKESIEFLTQSFLDSDVFHGIRARIADTSVPFRQLDWGSWVIPATRSDILSLVSGWKHGWDLPGLDDEKHKPRQQRASCLAVIQKLYLDYEYVIVIEEF